MRRLGPLPAALAALVLAAPASAETVYQGQVDGARIGSGGPVVGYVVGSNVHFWWPGAGRSFDALGFRSPVALEGLARQPNGRLTVLGRARDGTWLALWDGRGLRYLHRDSREARFGPAGLALDRAGRPVVAYALWYPSRRTFLRLARIRADGRLTVEAVTRRGFPQSRIPPAAAPVVLPDGEIRVVEAYASSTIEWRLTGWGRILFASALGLPSGRVEAAAAGTAVHAAWTEEFPTLGPPAVALATRAERVRSGVAIENAVLGGLALAPEGVELAATRCLPASAFGAVGNGVCGGLVGAVGLDGIVADYRYDGGTRQLLLQTAESLQWFAAPGALATRVTLDPDLTGRVEGAREGTVTVYRERPGEARAVLATAPLAADGTFALPAPASPRAEAYRAVYADPATGIPYAALIGP